LATAEPRDAEKVAEELESYPHALAAGDAEAACEAWSPQAQREQSGRSGDFCAYLRRTVSEITLAERHRSAAAQAVRVAVDGDRAIGYLQYSDCLVAASGVELSRNESGDWLIERRLPRLPDTERCLAD
jgi:hypothetical protein